MNSTREKLTSLSLAFVVLLSIFAGTAVATHSASDYEFDAQLEDGKTYWQGQTLYRDEGHNNSSEVYEVVAAGDGSYLQQVQADENGTLLIDTSDMSTGSYVLEDENNTQVATFDVASQTLSVGTSDSDTSDYTYTFDFASNRVGFNVTVEADHGLNATELKAIFNPASERVADVDGDGDDEYVIESVSDGSSVQATFDKKQADTYDFTFDVTDTSASAAVTGFTVETKSDASASFTDSLYSDEEGDIADITIKMSGTDRVNLSIGDGDMNYQLNATVVDKTGDGKVTVQFNTFTAGKTGYNGAAVKGDDAITITSEDTLSSPPLDPGTYDLSVYKGTEEFDLSALRIQSRSTSGASSYAFPGSESPSSLSDVASVATEDNTVALGDKFAVEINASGMEGYLSSATASDLATGAAGVYVEVEQTNPGTNKKAQTLDVSQATLYSDGDKGTYFLVFDTDDYTELSAGDEYEVRFNMTEANDYIDDADEAESQDAKTTFAVEERTFSLDDADNEGVVRVEPKSNYVLSGKTTAAAGTEVTLVARAEGENAFLYKKDVAVSEDGTFSATYDFSSLEAGANFTIEMTGYKTWDAQAGTPAPTKYTVDFSAVNTTGDDVDATFSVSGATVENGSVDLIDGTYTVEATADGYKTASKEFTVSGADKSVELSMEKKPDKHALTVTVENAPDADITVDGKTYTEGMKLQDGTYTVEVSADGYKSATKQVTIDGADASVSFTLDKVQTATPTPTATPDKKSNDTSATTTTEDPGQPGFGVAVSLVAMLGAALLAFRRKD